MGPNFMLKKVLLIAYAAFLNTLYAVPSLS